MCAKIANKYAEYGCDDAEVADDARCLAEVWNDDGCRWPELSKSCTWLISLLALMRVHIWKTADAYFRLQFVCKTCWALLMGALLWMRNGWMHIEIRTHTREIYTPLPHIHLPALFRLSTIHTFNLYNLYKNVLKDFLYTRTQQWNIWKTCPHSRTHLYLHVLGCFLFQ